MRERVPDNLRWFTMDIYIAEARNLRFRLPGVGQNVANLFGVNTGAIGNIVGGGNDLSNVLKDYGYIKFRCRQCEFDFSGSFAAGTTQSVITPTAPNTNSFNINIDSIIRISAFFFRSACTSSFFVFNTSIVACYNRNCVLTS
jgi:hypothetical protein